MDVSKDDWPVFPLMFERTEVPACGFCHSVIAGFHRYHCLLHPRWWLQTPRPQDLLIITRI